MRACENNRTVAENTALKSAIDNELILNENNRASCFYLIK